MGNILGVLVMRSPGGKYETAVLMLNDTVGLKSCQVYSFNQRQLKNFLDEWNLETTGIHLVPVERNYLDYLVFKHQKKNRDHHWPLPPDFVSWRRYFNPPEEIYEEHPIYKDIPLDSIKESLNFLLTRSEVLVQTAEMKNWLLEPSVVTEYAQKLLERRQSRIVVAEAFLQEFRHKLGQEMIEQLFTPDLILTYSQRLEHMAFIFHLTEQTENARVALAVAFDLKDGNTPTQNPLLRALALRSLDALAEMLEAGEPLDDLKTGQ